MPLTDAISPDVTRKIRQTHGKITDVEYDDIKQRAREGMVPLTREKLKRIERVRRENVARERRALKESAPRSCDYHTFRCDIREHREYKKTIPAGSVDTIITDPPYEMDAVDLYYDLRNFALHALRYGGNLFVLSGLMYLPDIMGLLDEEEDELYYNWTICYRMHGASKLIHQRGVHQAWKPVLWYTKGERDSEFIQDVFDVPKRSEQDTRFHEWGQNEDAIVMLTEKLCFPGQTICDPFLGGGTTAIAALERGCTFVGFDVESECIATTGERIDEWRNT